MTDDRDAGRAALARGDWAAARAAFAREVERRPSPEAYEGLGVAARYALDAEAAFAAHEEGYRRARAAGDADMAGRLAVQLSYDSYAFRGVAEAIGWAERAAMLVEGRPPSYASAFVPYCRAYMALLGAHDPAAACTGAAEAASLARRAGHTDLELLALALEGLARVASGEVRDGMAKLDAAAAAATGGEMVDADAIETVCCFVIDACKRVRDLERADEWCRRTAALTRRFDDRQMFTVCRVHHADILLWRGDLREAGRELESAAAELAGLRPGRDSDALVRLAEVRRRQGRAREARAILPGAGTHRLCALVEGLLALDAGDAPEARDAADRFLRRIGPHDRFERVAGLDLAVRAHLAAGDVAGARVAADEIARIAAGAGNPGLTGSARAAAGRIAAAEGDPETARALLDDAVADLQAVGARHEAALVGLELASHLRDAGLRERARRVDAAARDALAAMGAAVPAPVPPAGLSARETEVLGLLARGLSNEDIAARLVLSVRTVERHVANLYAKIGASGRTARAVATAWAHTRGIG